MPTITGRQPASPRWRVLTAASTGAHHIATGLPYEDAVGVLPATSRSKEEPSVAVAVADGHGHARHFRSARGSQLAVEIATELCGELATEVGKLAAADAVDKVLRTRVGPELVRTWRRAVERDLKDTPVTPEELSAAGLTAKASIDELVYGYGATLIVAVTAGPWLLCLQIGDGDLFAITDAGAILRPLPVDPRLDGSRTTSLCQPDAVESMRFAVANVAEKSIGAVMLATDGYGNAQVRNDWEVAFGSDLAALTAEHGAAWIGAQLPKWVAKCASSEGSGDDVTVALMFVAGTTWRRPARSGERAATGGEPAAGTLAAATVPDVLAPHPSIGRRRTPLSEAPTVQSAPPTVRASATPRAGHTRSPTPSTPAAADGRHRGLVITLSVLVAIAVIGLAALTFYATR